MPPLRVVAAYVSVALIWGSTWGRSRRRDRPDPFRFRLSEGVAVASVLTITALALASLSRAAPHSGHRTVVGLINIGLTWASSFGRAVRSSGLVAVFGSAAPVWTAVLAHFMVKGDRLSRSRFWGSRASCRTVPDRRNRTPRTGRRDSSRRPPGTHAHSPGRSPRSSSPAFLTEVAPIPTVAVGTGRRPCFSRSSCAGSRSTSRALDARERSGVRMAGPVRHVLRDGRLPVALSKLRPTTITLIQVSCRPKRS